MVKVEVTETFNFGDYEKVEIVQKKGSKSSEFTKGDIFICDNKIAEYLDGNNPIKRSVINVLEVIPEKTEEITENTIETLNEIDKTESEDTTEKEEPKKSKNTKKTNSKKIDKKIK